MTESEARHYTRSQTLLLASDEARRAMSDFVFTCIGGNDTTRDLAFVALMQAIHALCVATWDLESDGGES